MLVEQDVSFDDRLLEAPAEYRTPAERPKLDEARSWCKRLATTHYENFHVATFLLPTVLQPHFYSVYAFCRTSDDLGDEVPDRHIATKLLSTWRRMLQECFEYPEKSKHPVFVALAPTIASRNLPIQPFKDLISAFEFDQTYTHHESLETLEEYSRYSANPVGRLVLSIAGYRSEELMLLSDEICTALQLANFYQDIGEDFDRGRRYLPADVMEKFGVTDAQIADRRFDEAFRGMMRFLVEDARSRFLHGEKIAAKVDRDLASTLTLFVQGGYAILDAIAAQNYNTLEARPVVSKFVKSKLLINALAGKAMAAILPRRITAKESAQ